MMQGLEAKERENLKIDEYSIRNFLFGSSKQGKIETIIYEDLPMNVYFCVKVRNPNSLFSIITKERLSPTNGSSKDSVK